MRFLPLSVPILFVLGTITLMASVADSANLTPALQVGLNNYTEKLTSSDGKTVVDFDMIGVPGGEFLMGSPDTEKGHRPDEGPQIKVKLKAFWIGKCEVTWDEFFLFLKREDLIDEERKKLDSGDAITMPSTFDASRGRGFCRHPAIGMTHHTAMKYCEWLSKQTGKTYRLPTEAEWEYSCRAGSNTPHAVLDGSKLEDYAWYEKSSKTEEHPKGTTHPVATKKANVWGIHDMHGNVMEWCLDHYVEDAYKRFLLQGNPVLQPVILPTEKRWSHVARGGHFKNSAGEIRSAFRDHSILKWSMQDLKNNHSVNWLNNDTIGFRVCRPGDKDSFGIVKSNVEEASDNSVYEPK